MDANLSSRQTIRVGSYIRSTFGRRSVETGLPSALATRNVELQSMFHVAWMDMDVKVNGESARKQMPVILCNRLGDIVNKVMQERDVNSESHLLKIGIDGGGGMLKVCLTICKKHLPREQAECTADKRFCYQDGVGKRSFSSGGVRQLLIVGLAPDVSETYHNVQTLLETLDTASISFVLAADMKMVNIICGIQSPSGSTYPCPWCETGKDHFRSSPPGALRTVEKLDVQQRAYHSACQRAGRQLPAPKFKNCINKPLVSGSSCLSILDLIPPMELHLMLGVVNRLFTTLSDALREAGSSMTADDWAKELGISRSTYHGGQFEGNQCRKMLKEVDILQMMLERSGSYVGMPYVQALRAFNDVVTKTFGADLDPGYEAAIAEYRRCYMELKLPVNVKNHVIFGTSARSVAVTTVDWVSSQSRPASLYMRTSGDSGSRRGR